MELASRRERRSIIPVMAAVDRMNRNDSVNVLGAVANFGDDATTALVKALGNSKPFIRQGSALALAVLKNEEAIEALSDQLLSEPTSLWKEIARGLGMAGPPAIMSLASRLSEQDISKRERVSWALAHIAVRGGTKLIERMASGRDSVASAVARRALELREVAVEDDVNVRGQHTPSDQTVNRAFSRQFFQALEATAPVSEGRPERPAEMSSPALVLDEADLLEAVELEEDEVAELLDDNDLLPT